MPEHRRTLARQLFLNVGHAYDHLFMLLYPTVVIALESELDASYGELIGLSLAGFVAFGAGTLPAGWLGDRWSRRGMMIAFFVGIGGASIVTGLMSGPVGLAVGLGLIGLFAAIYHPVGIAMVAESTERVGRALGVNGVFGNLGVALAPLVAGVLVEVLGWRWAFILPGLVAVATGVLFALTPAPAPHAGSRKRVTIPLPPADLKRVFIVLAVATLFGGVVFHATTIALPKVMDVSLAGLALDTGTIGAITGAVFAVAAVAQIVVGHLIDRHDIKPVFFVVVGLQVPLLLFAASLSGALMIPVATGIMLLVFGEIPIHDTIVARYAIAAWRSRVYAVKYILSFGVSLIVVPLIGWSHDMLGGFGPLFLILAGAAAAILVCVLALPASRRLRGEAPEAVGGGAPAPAAGG